LRLIGQRPPARVYTQVNTPVDESGARKRPKTSAPIDLWFDDLDNLRARGLVIEHGCSIAAPLCARV
jgi:hypothetical protein